MANTTISVSRAENYALKIMNKLGLDANIVKEQFVSNVAETKPCIINGVTIRTHIAIYKNASVRVEVIFRLPETTVLAEEYIEHVGKEEKLRKNKSGRYSTGPEYRDWSSSLLKKDTDVYSPWNNHNFCVDSNYYSAEEIDEAVNNAIELAKPFVNHLPDLQTLRYWKSTDPEVIAKAKEIIANADLHETDCDREEKAHYLRDRNSFFHGWFSPFNDRGRGTFDTLWPSSVDHAAKGMGNEGTFEYAVACILLEDKDFIAKGRGGLLHPERNGHRMLVTFPFNDMLYTSYYGNPHLDPNKAFLVRISNSAAITTIRVGDQDWHDSAFFRLKAFKKGTIHLEFKDEALWAKFNQVVNKEKNLVGDAEAA